MHINWLGMSCFKIQTKENIIVTDPFADAIGIKMPKLKTDIVLLSDINNNEINNTQRLSGDFFTIKNPGEYDLKGTFIYGLKAGEKDQAQNLIFSVDVEGMTLGFLGLMNHSLTDEQLKIMEGVDVLFLPVSSLTSERRSKMISQIEPRVIIPMHYKISKLKAKLESVENFAKEVGAKNIEYQDKIILKKNDLPQDETKFLFLKPGI